MANVFTEAGVMQETSQGVAASTAIGWRVNMSQAIMAAAESGLRTASQSTTTAPASDILNSIKMLTNLGYGASIAGSTLTVTW